MRRTIVNFVIAAICFSVLTFREDLRPVPSFIIGLVVFGLLEIDKTLAFFGRSLPALPCFYKAEIVVKPDFRQLMNHQSVKGYYEKALPRIGRPDMLIPSAGTHNEQSEEKIGDHALWRAYELRFLIINNLFWSDYHKTFLKELRFRTRIIDYNLSQDDEEPYLDFEIKNGFLRFWFLPPSLFAKKEPQLICEFPLFVYHDIPSGTLDIKYRSKGWKDYISLRKLCVPLNGWGVKWERKLKQYSQIRSDVLTKYGFSPYSLYGFKTDVYTDRDGDSQIFDYDDGFVQYKNEYFVIKIKEFSDSL